ncbi:phosphoglycolate phosphatase-like HAD superfamily hydrolase [Actinoplanes campanulatus]|uniref:Phosphoglycolate phosphatase-like HAD superfamily hydrolase n=1 Tax=Actinoplanes campanulatus TaxID=113559 RepID=A0A7W5FG34_9ACTN|nr:HAD hydrolase-like protein [Actinoplanes campanulatus]MBB3097106.1 phosphoglycolate phosphatase-like HAD superfamily hydrolase [Actinoplanes campanulatus]GGN15749.1 phosphatase [Actinoplanes campanulatus]GID37713.1 phosphatase [Actinoplanes campanulatus]
MTSKHLVWDWNGTLLDDLHLVVSSTNTAFAAVGGRDVDADEHRRAFRRPVAEFYAEMLGRAVDQEEFGRLDRIFHDAYRLGLTDVSLAADAMTAIKTWPGSQSLLSMWFHSELIPAVEGYGLAGLFARVDGLRAELGGGFKAAHLAAHLDELGVAGRDVVLIGDSLDDADAAEAVGGCAVLYTGGFTHPARLRESGRPVADTLVEAVKMAMSL